MAKDKSSVKKAIEAIVSGDARALRNHIKEALIGKVKKAVDHKEKVIAKNLIKNITEDK